MGSDFSVIYWDASAILSVLFKDSHSSAALELAEVEGIHFMSTLAWSEVCAVIARMKRERIISELLEATGYEALRQGPWRRMSAFPDWEVARSLSRKWPLRGADLWHLATAKSLQNELPELVLLTFDSSLEQSAGGEGMACNADSH